MIVGFEIHPDGTHEEIEVSYNVLESTKAYCIVDERSQSIFLWKGKKTGVREKFVGAQVASRLRGQYGPQFKVRPLDEGEEPQTFLNIIK